MSLASELEELEKQRDAEVRTLHCTYLRTKREVKRTINPSRMVRKHLGLSLAAGAALGMLLAPRPSPRPITEEAAERAVRKAHKNGWRGGVSASWMKKLLLKVFPQAAEFIPEDADTSKKAEDQIRDEAEQLRNEAKAEGKKQKKRSSLGSLLRILETLLPLIASKVDWRTLINQIMHGVYSKMKDTSINGKDHEPHVSVADAGTVKPHDFEVFE